MMNLIPAVGLYLNYNGGWVQNSIRHTQLSDNRIKHNEKPLSNALKIINKVKPQKCF